MKKRRTDLTLFISQDPVSHHGAQPHEVLREMDVSVMRLALSSSRRLKRPPQGFGMKASQYKMVEDIATRTASGDGLWAHFTIVREMKEYLDVSLTERFARHNTALCIP
jgi:hypothetical protein